MIEQQENNNSKEKKKTDRVQQPIPLEVLYRIGVTRVTSQKKGAYYAARLYKASYRRDGIITYKPVKQVSDAYTSWEKARSEGIQKCIGIPFDPNVKQGKALFLKPDASDFEN